MKSPISLEESKDLIRLESEIEAGRKSWIAAGRALIEIRDRELFRSDHDDFWGYCEARWGWKRRNALYVIESCEVYATLPEGVQNFAQSASQVRELAKVEPAKREAVLEKAKKSGKVTAKAIKEAAQEDPEPTEDGLIPGPPPPVDEKWLAAMGKSEASEFKPSEPMVTEYYNRLEALVNDALENATEKQLNSMVVYAKIIPGLVRDELNQRKVRK